MIIEIFISGIILCVGTICVLLITARHKRRLRKNALLAECKQYANRITQYEERSQLIVPHALRYTNSLSAECRQSLLRIRRVLNSEHQSVERILKLIHSKKELDVGRAEQLLSSRFKGGRGFAAAWEAELKAALEIVAENLFTASNAAEILRTSQTRTRRPTLSDLRRAGFIESVEHQESGVSSAEVK